MQIGPVVIMKSSEAPFYREIRRQIDERPELRVAIEKGVAHVAINPRWREWCLDRAYLKGTTVTVGTDGLPVKG